MAGVVFGQNLSNNWSPQDSARVRFPARIKVSVTISARINLESLLGLLFSSGPVRISVRIVNGQKRI